MRSTRLTRLLLQLFAVVAIATAVLVTACSGGGNDEGNDSAGPDIGLTPVVEASPTPVPSPTPLADRTNCDEIKGTGPRSDGERAWFDDNCLPPPPRATVGSQVSIGDRLRIPGAGIDTEVYSAAVTASGIMPDPAGYFNAVWYEFQDHPHLGGYAHKGNLVLSGHVDCARCVNGGPGRAVFYNIRNMKVGDTAQYQLADGTTIDYVVIGSQDYSPSADWQTIVSAETADMTLITCTGTFSGGEYSHRHVVALKKVV